MTPHFEVIIGKRWHCGSMARKIRQEHDRGTRDLGLATRDGITVAFVMSSEVRAWMINHELAALGGVIGTEVSETLVLWLAVSEYATRFPIAMFKTAKEWLKIFGENRKSLRTTIILDDIASVRFAEKLGFRRIDGQGDERLGVMEWMSV